MAGWGDGLRCVNPSGIPRAGNAVPLRPSEQLRREGQTAYALRPVRLAENNLIREMLKPMNADYIPARAALEAAVSLLLAPDTQDERAAAAMVDRWICAMRAERSAARD